MGGKRICKCPLGSGEVGWWKVMSKMRWDSRRVSSQTFLILVCGICKAKSCLGIITNIQQPLDESLVVIFTGMNLDCYSAFSRPTNVTFFKRNIGIDLRQNLFSVGIFAYMSADFVWDLKSIGRKNHLRQILPNTFPTAEISADGGSSIYIYIYKYIV